MEDLAGGTRWAGGHCGGSRSHATLLSVLLPSAPKTLLQALQRLQVLLPTGPTTMLQALPVLLRVTGAEPALLLPVLPPAAAVQPAVPPAVPPQSATAAVGATRAHDQGPESGQAAATMGRELL